jgi:hypothetical protein
MSSNGTDPGVFGYRIGGWPSFRPEASETFIEPVINSMDTTNEI